MNIKNIMIMMLVASTFSVSIFAMLPNIQEYTKKFDEFLEKGDFAHAKYITRQVSDRGEYAIAHEMSMRLKNARKNAGKTHIISNAPENTEAPSPEQAKETIIIGAPASGERALAAGGEAGGAAGLINPYAGQAGGVGEGAMGEGERKMAEGEAPGLEPIKRGEEAGRGIAPNIQQKYVQKFANTLIGAPAEQLRALISALDKMIANYQAGADVEVKLTEAENDALQKTTGAIIPTDEEKNWYASLTKAADFIDLFAALKAEAQKQLAALGQSEQQPQQQELEKYLNAFKAELKTLNEQDMVTFSKAWQKSLADMANPPFNSEEKEVYRKVMSAFEKNANVDLRTLVSTGKKELINRMTQIVDTMRLQKMGAEPVVNEQLENAIAQKIVERLAKSGFAQGVKDLAIPAFEKLIAEKELEPAEKNVIDKLFAESDVAYGADEKQYVQSFTTHQQYANLYKKIIDALKASHQQQGGQQVKLPTGAIQFIVNFSDAIALLSKKELNFVASALAKGGQPAEGDEAEIYNNTKKLAYDKLSDDEKKDIQNLSPEQMNELQKRLQLVVNKALEQKNK